VDWPATARDLRRWAEPDAVLSDLRDLAARLCDIPGRLEALGMPPEAFRLLQMERTEERLIRWGLR
jgi:hypothetical protein